jgi:hypothetical protein
MARALFPTIFERHKRRELRGVPVWEPRFKVRQHPCNNLSTILQRRSLLERRVTDAGIEDSQRLLPRKLLNAFVSLSEPTRVVQGRTPRSISRYVYPSILIPRVRRPSRSNDESQIASIRGLEFGSNLLVCSHNTARCAKQATQLRCMTSAPRLSPTSRNCRRCRRRVSEYSSRRVTRWSRIWCHLPVFAPALKQRGLAKSRYRGEITHRQSNKR